MTITLREWRPIEGTAIAVAFVNAVYCLVEKGLGLRLIDPSILAVRQKIFLTPSGVPGYYVSYFQSTEYVRAGGLFLNPAITGVSCAVGAVLVSMRPGRYAKVATIIMAAGTLLTFSRAGMLILALGLGYRQIARLLGRIAATVPLVAGVVLGSGLILTRGSEAHAEGLFLGINDVVAHPLGKGFGYAGNLLAAYGGGPTESLLAIALTSGGLVPATLFAAAIVATARPARSPQANSYRLLALALLVSAAFAETAGAINATVPAWAVVGLVCSGSLTIPAASKIIRTPRSLTPRSPVRR
jgi:hypothetical protein